MPALSQPFMEAASIQSIHEWVFLFMQNFIDKDGSGQGMLHQHITLKKAKFTALAPGVVYVFKSFSKPPVNSRSPRVSQLGSSRYMSYGSSSLGNPTLGAAQGYLVLGLLIAVRA